MIIFRLYIAANDQMAAEAIANGYLLVLKKVTLFKTKLVRPYWKITGLYEVYLESIDGAPNETGTFSRLVSIIGGAPQLLSETEAVWSELGEDFFLPCAKWAHVELIT